MTAQKSRILRVVRFPPSWTGKRVSEMLFWAKAYQVIGLSYEGGFHVACWVKPSYLGDFEKSVGEYLVPPPYGEKWMDGALPGEETVCIEGVFVMGDC